MASIINTAYPPYFINAYIVEQLTEFEILTGAEEMIPVFPTSPTNFEDTFKNYVGAPGVQDPVIIQYERLLRSRNNYFYPKKKEQTILYIYSTSFSKVTDSVRVISASLDREDAAAQDVNAWIAQNPPTDSFGDKLPLNAFFHCFKVFQVEETRNLMNIGSNRTVYVNKIIVEYDYHASDPTNMLYK